MKRFNDLNEYEKGVLLKGCLSIDLGIDPARFLSHYNPLIVVKSAGAICWFAEPAELLLIVKEQAENVKKLFGREYIYEHR